MYEDNLVDFKAYYDKVYKSFANTYPELHKKKVYWCPIDDGFIRIWIDDGRLYIYDYYDQSLRPIKQRWIHPSVRKND